MAAPSKKEHWTTYDGACTSCRARKVRCGREKPQCDGCCRDQIQCVYSSAPKRVNHVKVLSQSFDDIQDRLIMMQEELSWLTATLKKSNMARRSEPEFERDSPSAEAHRGGIGARMAPAGHVIRDGATQIERYHGPWTLVALCRDLGADLASHADARHHEVIAGLADRMLSELSRIDDDNLNLGAKPGEPDTGICLPPRQLLSIMLDSFLKQADYSTDIFSRQSIYEAVDRVYLEPSNPASEAWALCFNLVILLTLGAEHPVCSDDPFARPMLQAVYATARKQNCFMFPRLVNIQALALMSLLVQQYHTDNKTLGDSFFTHACTLARESGLTQAGPGLLSRSGLSAVEAEERDKIFRSLFIRDRYSVIARGAPAWLPGAAPGAPLSPSISIVDGQEAYPSHAFGSPHAPHWELVEVQDQLHRLLYSTDLPAMSTSERRTALARLQQKLRRWTQTHKVPSSHHPTTVDEISLHLALLGTRIRMLDTDNIANGATCSTSPQVINDARLSCLLVATSCTYHRNQALVNRLHRLLNKTDLTEGFRTHQWSAPSSPRLPSSPVLALASSATDTPPRADIRTPPRSSSGLRQASFVAPLPFHRLENVFPVAAVFVLTRHILGIGASTSPSQSASTADPSDEHRPDGIDQDILLLEALLPCFRSTAPHAAEVARGTVSSDVQGSKLGRTIQHLVDIIRAIVGATGRSDADDADDADGEGDDEVYASELLLTSASSLPADSCSDGMSMPSFDLYGNGGVSPSQTSMPHTSSSSRSTRAPSQDFKSSPATLLWTPQSSLYGPSITPMPPMIHDTPFDISQFLNQMTTSGPGVWDDGQRQAELQMQEQQQQQAQCTPKTARKQSRKRPRTDEASIAK